MSDFDGDTVVPNSLDGERIDRALSLLYGVSRHDASLLIAQGSVNVSANRVKSKSLRLRVGDVIHVEGLTLRDARVVTADASVPLDLVYFDGFLAVVNKRAGQVVHLGSGVDDKTMVNALVALFPQSATVGDPERPGVVHRLDKGTSGLMLFALTTEVLVELQQAVALRHVRRQYLALVEGHMEHDQGTIQGAVGRSRHDVRKMEITDEGREAESHYSVVQRISRDGEFTVVRVVLGTGRTHQIRVHLQALGHSVVGDHVYGAKTGLELERPFLHAERLGFIHPISGRALDFTCSLPEELRQYLERCRLDGASV